MFTQLITGLNLIKNRGEDFTALNNCFFDPDLFSESFFEQLCAFSGRLLQRIPLDSMSPDAARRACLNAVKDDGSAWVFVPVHILDTKIATEALRSAPAIFSVISQQFMNEEMIHIYLDSNEFSIDRDAWLNIPNNFRNRNFAIKALTSNPYSALHMTAALLSDEEVATTFVDANRTNYGDDISLSDLEDWQRTEAVINAFLNYGKTYWNEIYKYIPNDMKTQEMTEYVIEDDTSNFQYIPLSHITDDIIKTVVDFGTRINLENLPHEIISKFIALDGHLLETVDPQSRTSEICMLALKTSIIAINYVPKKLITSEMIDLLISSSCTLDKITNKTIEICERLVLNDYKQLQFCPHEFQTSEMVKHAVKCRGRYLKYVREDLKTYEICSLAMENGNPVDSIPEPIRQQLKIQ